jgi:hypothetical protein
MSHPARALKAEQPMASGASRRVVRTRSPQPTLHQLELLASYARTGSKAASAEEFGIPVSTLQRELRTLLRRLEARDVIDAFNKLGWLTVPDLLELPGSPEAIAPTSHQLEVLATYVEADCVRQAADQLGVAQSTVKNLLTDLNRRLGVGTAVEACVAIGWLVIPESLDVDGSPRNVDVAVLAAYARAGTVGAAARQRQVTAATVKNRLKASYRALNVHRALEAYKALGWLRVPNPTVTGGTPGQ